MVSHGREGKTKDRRNKKKNNNNNSNDVDNADVSGGMELPDDFSICGEGSSVASSNMGGFGDDADEYYGDEDGGEGAAADDNDDAAKQRANKLNEALSLAATLTSDKRSTKREGVHRTLFKAITQYATGSTGQEILESNWGNVSEACLFSLRSGKSSEQYAACRVLEASSIILGEDQDEIVCQLNAPLKKIVNATGRATVVRCAALRCLSMVHFICGTDCLEEGEDSMSVIELCEKVAAENYRGESVNPLLRATGLDCWSLLSTTFHDAHIASGDGHDDTLDLGRGLQLLNLLASCLDSSDAGLRRSAGECVSLIHEARLNLGLDEDEAHNTTQRKFRRGSWDGSEWEVLMDEVKQRIAELSVDSSKVMSKQAKKLQRANFRDFNNTIVDDESPDEVVNWRGGKLTLKSWKEIIQLNFIRHCLQGGFQIQLMTNETLQGVFGVTYTSGSSLSRLEKRLYMSKTSEAAKAADKAMTKQRKTRTNVKNHFLTADGDDI